MEESRTTSAQPSEPNATDGTVLPETPIASPTPGRRKSTRIKRKPVQLTFDDFPSVKTKKSKNDASRKRPSAKNPITTPSETINVVTKKTETTEPEVKGGISDEIINEAPHLDIHSHTSELFPTGTILPLKRINALSNLDFTSLNWTPNVPINLLDRCIGSQAELRQQWSPPQFKPTSYASQIIKIMTFINKFDEFCPAELKGLSFQEFEYGLELVHEKSIPINRIKDCQDSMNLLLLLFLKLLLHPANSKADNLPLVTLNQVLRTHNPFGKLIRQLRTVCKDWGIPKEWRSMHEQKNHDDEQQVRESASQTHTPTPVTPIDTSSNYADHQELEIHTNIYGANNPLYTVHLGKVGLIALKPFERLKFLSILIDWCCLYSPYVHNHIYYLSHLRTDAIFGWYSENAPKHLIYGKELTIHEFSNFCRGMLFRWEKRIARGIKRSSMTKEQIEEKSQKVVLAKKLKAVLRNVPEREKDAMILENIEDFEELMKGEFRDHPLSDPYETQLYKLRASEFLIGKVSGLGEFYLPRLCTYFNKQNNPANTYTNMEGLTKIADNFQEGKISSTLIANNPNLSMSRYFKLLFKDTTRITEDVVNSLKLKEGHQMDSDKVYWYELAHDNESLESFMLYLNDFIDQQHLRFPDAVSKLQNMKSYLSSISKILQIYDESASIEKVEDVATDGSRESSETINGRPLRASRRRTVDYHTELSDQSNEEEVVEETEDEEQIQIQDEEENRSEYEVGSDDDWD